MPVARVGDEFFKRSQKTGASVEALTALDYAAKLSDVSTEGLTKAMQKLSVAMFDTLVNGEEGSAALKALGVSATDVNGQIRSWSASGMYANNLLLQGDGTNATIRPTNSGSALNLGANNSNYAIVAANGNFGVNTTTPAYKVDVSGDVRATGNVIATNVNATNLNGAITSSQVTTALGFTPYNSTNPSNFANSTNSLNINGNANNITAYTINQSVGTSNSPTFTRCPEELFGRNSATPWTAPRMIA